MRDSLQPAAAQTAAAQEHHTHAMRSAVFQLTPHPGLRLHVPRQRCLQTLVLFQERLRFFGHATHILKLCRQLCDSLLESFRLQRKSCLSAIVACVLCIRAGALQLQVLAPKCICLMAERWTMMSHEHRHYSYSIPALAFCYKLNFQCETSGHTCILRFSR